MRHELSTDYEIFFDSPKCTIKLDKTDKHELEWSYQVMYFLYKYEIIIILIININ
jgi:hypothetical protein